MNTFDADDLKPASDKKYLKYQPREKNKIMDLIISEEESVSTPEEILATLRRHRNHFLVNQPGVFVVEADQIVKRLKSTSTLIDLGCWTGVLGRMVLDKAEALNRTPREYLGIDAGLYYIQVAAEVIPPPAKFRSFFIFPDSAVELNLVNKLYFDIFDPLNTSGFYSRRVIPKEKLSAMPIGKTIRPCDFAIWLRNNYELEHLYLKTDIEGIDHELVHELIRYDTLPEVLHFELLEKFTSYWDKPSKLLAMKYDFIPPACLPDETYIIVAVRKGSGLSPTTITYNKRTKAVSIQGDA